MMWVLGIVVFVSFVGVGIVVPLFPFFAARIGAAPEMITTMMAVGALLGSMTVIITGRSKTTMCVYLLR